MKHDKYKDLLILEIVNKGEQNDKRQKNCTFRYL